MCGGEGGGGSTSYRLSILNSRIMIRMMIEYGSYTELKFGWGEGGIWQSNLVKKSSFYPFSFLNIKNW